MILENRLQFDERKTGRTGKTPLISIFYFQWESEDLICRTRKKQKFPVHFLGTEGIQKGTNVMLPPPAGGLISADSCLSEIPLSPRIPTIAGPAATNTMEGRLMLNTSSDLCKQFVFQICQLVSNFADLNQRKEKH